MSKLLIVDDEDAMRGLYKRRLSSFYEVFETGDPSQALALALEHKPDAILLDLKMPKYDGFELCQNFRSLSHTSDIPIFVITGQSGDHREDCEAMGATGYFEKPINFERLKITLEAALRARPEPRSQIGELRMRVPLKVVGMDAGGKQFADRMETESVSAEGFLCLSPRSLEEGFRLEVFLAGQIDRYAGLAGIVERVPAGRGMHWYRFEFIGEKESWILQ